MKKLQFLSLLRLRMQLEWQLITALELHQESAALNLRRLMAETNEQIAAFRKLQMENPHWDE